jgi:tetratricopeptide (TPR) repeat protein
MPNSTPLPLGERGQICCLIAALALPPGFDSYGEAINSFEHALALDPQSIEAKGWLANALVGRVSDLHPSSSWSDLKRADTLASQALAASPGSTPAHLAKGQLLRVERRCDEAIPEFEMVIALPRPASGWARVLFPSIAQMKAHGYWGVPKIDALFEATYFADLRKAGVPEE